MFYKDVELTLDLLGIISSFQTIVEGYKSSQSSIRKEQIRKTLSILLGMANEVLSEE